MYQKSLQQMTNKYYKGGKEMNCILSQRKSVKSINDMFRENYGQAQESIKKSSKK